LFIRAKSLLHKENPNEKKAGIGKTMEKESHSSFTAAYEIRVKDHLEDHWLTYFMDWSIENLENGEVLLTTPGIDQAGLHGVLNKIRDLNLTLLSVKQKDD
jgi:hypothetical protein